MDKIVPKSSEVFQANRDRAAPLLARLKADGIGHIIDGKAVPSISGETFETRSPVDGATLASVARGNAEDIDRAATAAAQAFKAWHDMPATMRKKLLRRVADAIEDHADDIAVLECIDTGQAHRFMAKAAIRGAENFRFFADKCTDARDGLNLPSDEHWNVSTRVPIGPVGVITPTGPIGTRVDTFQCSSLGRFRPSRASVHLSAKKRKFSAPRIAALAMKRWAWPVSIHSSTAMSSARSSMASATRCSSFLRIVAGMSRHGLKACAAAVAARSISSALPRATLASVARGNAE